MKIAIIGTRGIPNNHGGFEQFAEYFSVFLANQGHEVYVYNSHDHPFQENKYKNVNIIHCNDPEHRIGTAGQFIYDLNCILNSRKHNFHVILQLGYTSSTIWHRLLPKKPLIVTNMDGLEWKRTKYHPVVRKFLRYAEKLGAKHSDFLIADSLGIQEHLKKTYNKESKFIAYGAKIFDKPQTSVLEKYGVKEHNYCIIIARLEPENNIETILNGFSCSKIKNDILVFGKLNPFGNYLCKKYENDKRIKFVGTNYNINELNSLRYYSRYYFHGHSVGGTNPSLLEAMSSNSLIIAHNNIFNKSVLRDGAIYFDSESDLNLILDKDDYFCLKDKNGIINAQKIKTDYNWELINDQYETYLKSLI